MVRSVQRRTEETAAACQRQAGPDAGAASVRCDCASQGGSARVRRAPARHGICPVEEAQALTPPMTTPDASTIGCPICESNEPGWVCEDHPDKPWEHDGCGAPGMRCVCNPNGDVRWRKVYAT